MSARAASEAARPRSFDLSAKWLPHYTWWPHPADFRATVALSAYQVAVEPDAHLEVVMRGYAGSAEPLWEHRIGDLRYGEQRHVCVADLDVPEPPPDGGVLEVHTLRHDREPGKGGVGAIFHWIDAVAEDGGGYLLPTQPFRGGVKRAQRDDVQVIPGVIVSDEFETELVLLNLLPVPNEVRLRVASVDGAIGEAKPFEVGPWSAWRAPLSRKVPRLGRLLEPGAGIGSLEVHSAHKLLPYFGIRRSGGPVVSMDHAANIFV